MTQLTTTSYSLLALLARRPWSAYDITQYMKLSPLRRVWPKAESRIYAEPKRLVAAGMAEVTEEYNGKRKSSIYSITVTGRKALSEWLKNPTGHFEYKYEVLVKLLSADHGTREDVSALLDETKTQALLEAKLLRDGMETILEQGFKMPEMAEFNTWIMRFMINDIESRIQWVKQMQQRLPELSETAPGGNESEAREVYKAEIQYLDELLDRHW
jgi:DNA-binding PadR family transcriptional regulator